MSEERFAAIETKIDALHGEMHDLGRQMRVLHEDVIDSIKALAPDFAPVRREFKAADDQLREEFDRRLTPVEAALRKRQ